MLQAADPNADFMGLRWGHLHILNDQRMAMFPSNGCPALDHLKSNKKNNKYFVFVAQFSSIEMDAILRKENTEMNIKKIT